MSAFNGGLIGIDNSPTISSADGLWSLRENLIASKKNIWPKYVVQNGLAMHLDSANPDSYTEGSSTWYDLGPNQINASLSGSYSYSTINGGAIYFNNTGEARTGSSSIFNYFNSNYTLEVWFYGDTFMDTADPNQYFHLFKVGSSDASDSMLHTAIWRSGLHPGKTFNSMAQDASLGFGTTGNTSGSYVGPDYKITGKWSHFAYVGNGSTNKFYINGSPVATQTAPTYPNSNTFFHFGNFSNPFYGYAGVVSAYTRDLSDDEIAYNFNIFSSRYNVTFGSLS